MDQTNKIIMPLPVWLYIIGWLFFVYLFIGILGFSADGPNNLLVSGLYLIEFGVHEISHIITGFLPAILTASAGSVGEVSFTLLVLFACLKQKAYFAATFAGLWIMLALISVGNYMADARAQQLPLIGPPGETVQHDWHFVFSQLGWLNADTAIGGTVHVLGVVIGVISLITGLYLIYLKIVK